MFQNPAVKMLSAFIGLGFVLFASLIPDARGQCRRLRFTIGPIHGQRLENHVIRTIDAIGEDVCKVKCLLEPNCVSYNFKTEANTGGKHECDLNNASYEHDNEHAGDLVKKENYVYRGAENACSKEPCQNNSTCQAGFTERGYQCLCIAGFTGHDCEVDVNECTEGTHSCDVNAVCNNTRGSYDCTCKDGFYGDGKTCEDIDECVNGTHWCDVNAVCNNTRGSYNCTCKDGFHGDGINCTDIDECASSVKECNDGLEENSTDPIALYPLNSEYQTREANNRQPMGTIGANVSLAPGPSGEPRGSYQFKGQDDSYIEFPNNGGLNVKRSMTMLCWVYMETLDVSGPLFSYYSPTQWGIFLRINSGKLRARLLEDTYSSTELSLEPKKWHYVGSSYDHETGKASLWLNGTKIKESNIGAGITLATEQTVRMGASAIPGGRSFKGRITAMQVYDVALTAGQINEVKDTGRGTRHICDVNAVCTNAPGSYSCACREGFYGNGVNCSDINECASRTHNCSVNAVCNNTRGSYNCTCKDGFYGDGTNCTDINECANGTHNCSVNAVCNNTRGSHNCTCKDGFHGDGINCTDIDECINGTHKCDANAVCSNTWGSHNCTCKDGFHGDGINCLASLTYSSIVGNNQTLLTWLDKWLKPVTNQSSNWIRCYQATVNGWSSYTFHSNCDGKFPSVTIIRVGKYIFGGYTSLAWGREPSSGCYYSYDSKAFLFSLVNKPGLKPLKLNQTGKYSYQRMYSFYHCYSHGPTFGGGHDVYIANNAGSDIYSYSNLGYTYSPPPGNSFKSSFTRSFLAGSYNFRPDEVEVFYETS